MNNIKNQFPIGSINRLFAFACCLMMTLFVGVQLAVAQPLTNMDVVKLSSLGLGDEVVIAKIKQAPEVAFSLEIAGIEKLTKDGSRQKGSRLNS